ncbi:4-methylaminobutanoate oxidase (formaldehyde-forming) [Labrenzia sp. THAF82]|uniref:GcvT family protein n=1 Tax=Labrenzia sp. THAF82 TaxID=2587861 RepID=UPI001267DEB5|nr:FAD-dependent oxidoreductase [Labrenzia sp. THAF82]QFT31687.1 4-methylaminobutanoate oxidase (formaldehyde-forming) [Labrenzia sp. THAF82]
MSVPSTARVVIIGGGVVGVATLYHLAKNGWSDCILLEKNELTAGSTWHAAGNCPNFAMNYGIMNMQRYSLKLYRGLADEVDYPINYHVTGAIRLAHSDERMMEFEHAVGMARQMGLKMDICTPEELQQHYPFMETHDLAGGLWDALDGDIDPAQVTQALAKGARAHGAKITRFTPATGVSRENGEWIVHTDKGDIRCEYVVNAAGYYAKRVGEWFLPFGGRPVPAAVMSHQYFLTEPVPEVEAWTKENGRKLPMIRDVDSSYYLRQETVGFNLGPYERNCQAAWVTPDDQMPEDFSFQLYPDDLDRLEWYIEDAMARVPLLGTQGVSRNINGPIPYAPDGLPMIGPMPGVPNAFEAHSFTFGIAQGGGAGKVAAEWIMHGHTEWDMWCVDPRRYTDYTDDQYCVDKAKEVYGHEYAMHFPHHRWPAAPDRKVSPNHTKVLELGGQMGTFNGWERANWFAEAGDDIGEEATQTWNRSGPWEQRVRAECEAVRDGVGVLDLPGFSRFALNGEGAAEYLRNKIAGALPKAGRMTLGYFPDNRGRVLTEMSIIRHGEDDFTLITAAPAQWHDFAVLKDGLPEGLSLKDRTREVTTLIVSGPKSRELFAKLTDADLSTGWLTHQYTEVAGKPALLVRVSFAGELGWEVHASFDDMPVIYDAVLKQGATPFGMFALNSLRLEKGYRAWKVDLSSDYTLLESGLGRFVKLQKLQDYPGKSALQTEAEQGPKKGFVTLTVDADACDAPYMACIFKDGELVGEVTSGGWGYRINASIALGVVKATLAEPGTELEVEIYGKRHKAVVQPDQPLWDPENERLRA